MPLSSRVQDLLKRLQNNNIQLVAVSKTRPISDILDLYEQGHLDFGENRVQELVEKASELPTDIRWHMIGHLQRNKVRFIAPFVHLIHSVDSLKLLKEINKQAKRNDRVIDCLLQIHIALERTKFGFSEKELFELADSVDFQEFKNVRICGFMGMATFTEDTEQVSKEFRLLKSYFDIFKKDQIINHPSFDTLSMGMTSDFHLAIEEGATMVRLGSLIFGARNKT